MQTIVRKIVVVDESVCDGCGKCVFDCPQGALAIVDEKARVVGEAFCDGLGGCLSSCPVGALSVVRREAEPFDEAAVNERLAAMGVRQTVRKDLVSPVAAPAPAPAPAPGAEESRAHNHPARTAFHWPLKLRLAPLDDPLLQGADLAVCGDCAAFASKEFHAHMGNGRIMLIGCPKFEDPRELTAKLAELFTATKPSRCMVFRMEKPCCKGLVTICADAAKAAEAEAMPLGETIVYCNGAIEDQ